MQIVRCRIFGMMVLLLLMRRLQLRMMIAGDIAPLMLTANNRGGSGAVCVRFLGAHRLHDAILHVAVERELMGGLIVGEAERSRGGWWPAGRTGRRGRRCGRYG